MSGGDAVAEEAAVPDEPQGGNERAAKAVLALVAVGVAWGVLVAAPWLAYVVVGVMLTLGWQKAAAWRARHRDDDGAGEDDTEPADDDAAEESVPETLHRCAGPHVFLADFADARGLSKEAARAVLEVLAIPVRRAVRNGDRTGVGVHRDDIPPLPRPLSEAPVEGVDVQQQHNQQANVRVQRTNGGVVIYDLTDNHRHHRIK